MPFGVQARAQLEADTARSKLHHLKPGRSRERRLRATNLVKRSHRTNLAHACESALTLRTSRRAVTLCSYIHGRSARAIRI